MKKSSIAKSSLKKSELKKTSKLTSWPKNAAERRKLYDKYRSGHENLSYQFLEMMIKGEDIFKGITKPVIKRAYIKADEIGSSKNEGLITRKEFPFFLKYLLYFTDLFQAFSKIDEDKNKKLTLDEFIKNRSVLEAKMTKERAEELFQTMDKDGGGSISFDEFCNWALEQPNFLNYNNLEYFKVETNANDDEDPEEVLPEIKLKTQESEEFKEDFDSSPQNNLQNIEEIKKADDSELLALKNEIIKLKTENQELIAKLFQAGNKTEKSQENFIEDKSETNKKLIELMGEENQTNELNEEDKNISESRKLEEFEGNQKENELKSEIEAKTAEIQTLQERNKELVVQEAQKLEEAQQREYLLQQELESKSNQIETLHKEKNLMEKRIDELAEVQSKFEQQETLIEKMKNQIEEENEQKKIIEELLEKTKKENENQLNMINSSLNDCEGRCLKFQDSLQEQEFKFKEEILKMEEELKNQLSKQSAEYEEKIANEIEARKKLQDINDEEKQKYEEKISFEKKTHKELENKVEILEKMIQNANFEDLKSKLMDLETKNYQELSKREELETQKINLEKELQELKAALQEIELEKETMKKSHDEDIGNLSSLRNDLEEKLVRMEQNNLEKQMQQEKEFTYKLEEFNQKEQERKYNFEAIIQQLENEKKLDKAFILEQEKLISQLRAENDTQIKSLNDKEIQLKEHQEILKNYDNMKKEGNSDIIIKEYEKKTKDLMKELESNKSKIEQNEKRTEEIKIKYELEIKEKTVNYESMIQQERERFLKIEKDYDQLNKHLAVLENESNELKKELKSNQFIIKKGLEIENIKISENKNKEEIYLTVNENKSNEEPLLNNGEQKVIILKKNIYKLKIIIFIISLFAVAMLLFAILK